MATTTGGDIKINITGDSAPLVEALGKAQVGLDKTTVAAAKTATSVQKITVSSDAVTASVGASGKALDKSRSSAVGAGAAFEKSGSALMKVAGAASLVNPVLGEMFRNLGDVADVGEVVTAGGVTVSSDAVTASVGASGKALDKSRSSAVGAGAAFEKSGSALMKVAGAASLVNPVLGEMFRNLGDVADVGEVVTAGGATLAASLGALAVVAAEVGAVYYVLTANEREAARVSAEVAEAHQALTPITDALRMATIDLDEATGKLTETQAANARASLEAFAQLQAATEGTRGRLSELAKEQGSVWTQMVDGVESIVPAWTPMGAAIRAVTTDSADLQAETDALNGVLAEAREKTAALVDTEHKATETKAAHKVATDALKESLDRLNEAAAKEIQTAEASADTYRGALASLQKQEDAAQRAIATKAEAIEVDRLAAIASAEAERDKALAVSASVEARETIEAQFAATRQAIEEQAREDRAKAVEADVKAEAEAADKRLEIAKREAEIKVQIRQQSEDAVVGILGSAADAAYTISQRIGEDNKEAALAAFYIAQGAAAAQAAVNTVLAASRAMAEVPYPANIAVAAGAVAAGAASEIAILSTPAPTFSDTPGVQSMPMGGQVNLGAGDYFAAARDPEDLRRQVDRVAFRSSASGPTVMLIGRQMYGRQLRDATEWQSPMVQAIAGTTPSGGRR